MAAFAQSSQPLQKPSVAGRVLRQNGDVALRVIVSLVGPERYTMTSDARGAFAFGGVAPGTYSLIAQRAGYSAVKYGGTAPLSVNCVGIDLASWSHAAGGDDAITTFRDCIDRAPGVALTVAPGLDLKDLTIRIAQTGVIRGTVTNQDLDGVPGIMTALVRDLGARTLRTVATASIGQDGHYTVDDLPPGRYYLLARSVGAQMLVTAIVNGAQVLMAMNQGPAGGAPSESEVATYHPSETDDSKAVPVEVKAGDELRGVNVLMRRSRTFSVRGAVAMPAGSPQGSMALTMTPKGAQNNVLASNRAVAGPGGSFEFRAVSPGTYVISGGTQALFGRREVSVAASDLEGVSVTMSPAAALTGMVKMEGAAPAVWPSVTLASDDGSFSGTLKPGPDGKFTAPAAMPPVDYTIQLGAMPPGVYVKSMSFGSQDVLRGKLDMGAASSGVLEIVLSRNAAALTGKVTDAAGSMQGVRVTAWPRNAEQGGRVHLANTDQDGNFSIADLAPGDYWAAAWEALPAALSGDPGFLGRFQSSAAAVRLEEGARAKPDLKVIPREKSDAEASRLP
jgi:hypothetical protein